METRGSQKVDLSSQVIVGGNVWVSEEKTVGISRMYVGSDVALSRSPLSLCQRLIPELYLFGGLGEKPQIERGEKACTPRLGPIRMVALCYYYIGAVALPRR